MVSFVDFRVDEPPLLCLAAAEQLLITRRMPESLHQYALVLSTPSMILTEPLAPMRVAP